MTKKMTITLEEELIEELAATAQALGKKKAQVVREALQEYLPSASKKSLETAWLAENADAIVERNSHVEKYGLFGEEYRRFKWRSLTFTKIPITLQKTKCPTLSTYNMICYLNFQPVSSSHSSSTQIPSTN